MNSFVELFFLKAEGTLNPKNLKTKNANNGKYRKKDNESYRPSIHKSECSIGKAAVKKLNALLTKTYQLCRMNFPQYRRYLNGMSYFKILNQEEFMEYKLTANQLEEFHFKAKILPDRNYIADMLNDYEQHWENIDEATFEAFIASRT